MLIYEKSNINLDHDWRQDFFAKTVNNRAHRYGMIFERQSTGGVSLTFYDICFTYFF